MSTITTINSTDVQADSRSAINTNFSNLNTDKVETLDDLGVTLSASEINALPDDIASVFPTGMIVMTGKSSASTGWLMCDGSAVSRTTYADLFTAISTTYGVGDGSTTFNVPSMKGKVAVGRDSGQTEFDTLGETGGSKTHTLTESEIPAHSHAMTTFKTNTTGSAPRHSLDGNNTASTATTDSTGGGQAHNNLQPYIVVNYMIKT